MAATRSARETAVTSSGRAADPRPRERLGWLQLILGIVLFVICELVATTPAGIVYVTSPQDHALLANVTLAGMTVGALLSLLGFWGIVRGVSGRPVSELAPRAALRELGGGLLLGAALISIVMGILALLGCYRVEGIGWTPGIVMGLAIGIGPGFMEEILFRGFLLRFLDRWIGGWAALAVTSALFGAVHLSNEEATVFGAIAIALEAGILMGAAFLLTRRLWLSIGIHAAWNTCMGGLYGADVSGNGFSDGLLKARFTGPDLLTGGSMGPEGSIIALLVCGGAGVVMLVLAVRRGMVRGRVRRQTRPVA